MNTQQMTRGAMTVAIYGALLFLNQQTAFAVESFANWIFIFPVLILTAMDGIKSGLIAGIGMALITFFFGGFTTWFYSWFSIITGWVYGIGINKQWKHSVNFMICFLITMVSYVLMAVLWASIFDMDMSQDYQELLQIVPWLDLKAYVAASLVLMSFLQAMCVHMVALLICLKMKIKIRPLQSFREIKSYPRIGYVSILIWGFFLFGQSMLKSMEGIQTILQICWFIDCIVLDFYGVLVIMDFGILRNFRKITFIAVFGAFIPIIQFIWMFLGECECLFSLRKRMSKRIEI